MHSNKHTHTHTHTHTHSCQSTRTKPQLATVPCHSVESVIAMGTLGDWCWHKKGREIYGVRAWMRTFPRHIPLHRPNFNKRKLKWNWNSIQEGSETLSQSPRKSDLPISIQKRSRSFFIDPLLGVGIAKHVTVPHFLTPSILIMSAQPLILCYNTRAN